MLSIFCTKWGYSTMKRMEEEIDFCDVVQSLFRYSGGGGDDRDVKS